MLPGEYKAQNPGPHAAGFPRLLMCRLKQGWDKPQTSPEPSSQSSSPRQSQVTSPDKDRDKQQYLRLPVRLLSPGLSAP